MIRRPYFVCPPCSQWTVSYVRESEQLFEFVFRREIASEGFLLVSTAAGLSCRAVQNLAEQSVRFRFEADRSACSLVVGDLLDEVGFAVAEIQVACGSLRGGC